MPLPNATHDPREDGALVNSADAGPTGATPERIASPKTLSEPTPQTPGSHTDAKD